MTKFTWRIARLLIFIIVGIMSTLFINVELKGSIQNYIGYGLLILAGVDIISIIYVRYFSKEKTDTDTDTDTV